jgi:hypothetical protein
MNEIEFIVRSDSVLISKNKRFCYFPKREFYDNIEDIKNNYIINDLEKITIVFNSINIYILQQLKFKEFNLIKILFNNLPISLLNLEIIVNINYIDNINNKEIKTIINENIKYKINNKLCNIKIPFGVEINVHIN